MTRFADPGRCPDCGTQIAPGTPRCPVCALPLTGATAQDLFLTLVRADELVALLRRQAVPAAPPAASSAGTAVPAVPAAAASLADAPRRGLSGASVPRVLLGLGALCLLVAALVFLAVAWSVLGVGGRTVALVAMTGIGAGSTLRVAGRGLRAASESLGLVTLGLLTLDVYGARHAGWLGHPSEAGFHVLLGLLLLAASVALTRGVRRQPAGELTAGEVVAGLAAVLVTEGVADARWLPTSPALVAGVLAAAALAAVLHGQRMPLARAVAAVAAGAAWLALAAHAVERVSEEPTWRSLWAGLEVWPLLVAAGLVAAPALVRRLPVVARVSAAGTGLLLVTTALVAPAFDEGARVLAPTAAAVLLGSALLGALAPRPWGLAAAGVQAVSALGVLATGVALTATALERVAHVAERPWDARWTLRLPALPAGTDLPQWWLLPVGVLALTATGAAVLRATGTPLRGTGRRGAVTAGAVLGLATLVATLALHPVPVAVLVGVVLLGAGGAVVVGLRTVRPALLGTAAALLAVAAVPAATSQGLTLLAALVTLLLGAAVQLRAGQADVAAAGGLVAAAALAVSCGTTGALLDAVADSTVLVTLAVLGATVLALPFAPERWWTAPVAPARLGVEVGAAAVALPLGTAGVLLAPVAEQASWAAGYLTLAGAVVTAIALLHADRRPLGWVGGGLLALASWVRLADVGVHAPEAYTLPSAAALLLLGLVRMRRDGTGTGSLAALGPGLGLALAPSLLWALDDPTSTRALLLGLACLGLVLAGTGLRWTAPVGYGATAGALLVLRFAAPYVDQAVPRWVLIGLAGALLVTLGTTWERRLGEARHALAYLRALR